MNGPVIGDQSKTLGRALSSKEDRREPTEHYKQHRCRFDIIDGCQAVADMACSDSSFPAISRPSSRDEASRIG
jgi:hypothetical protein